MAVVVSGFTGLGASNWTVPAGVTGVTVECWGGGGGGGAATGNPATGGAGAGGAYARSTFTVTAGNVLVVFVGSGGTAVNNASGNIGNASWFSGVTTIYAQGGARGALAAGNSTNGGAGQGDSGSTIGTVKYRGGNGALGDYTATTGYSGGGGAGPGPNAQGYDAVQISGGTAASEIGGAGAMGVRNSTAGNAGNNYGAGGSGGKANGSTNRQGGNGAQGYVRLTWGTPDGSQVKYWTGSQWTLKPIKVYLAGSWQQKPLKRWNGSQWITV